MSTAIKKTFSFEVEKVKQYESGMITEPITLGPDVQVRERYDPSLPRVRGDLDQLIQALLNIAKNATEAVHGQDHAELTFATSYRPGLKIRAAPSGAARRG